MITQIKGGSHTDSRGTICFVNDFDMQAVRRFYLLKHPDTSVVRAWQGHQREAKYFTCTRGSFLVCGVELDNFENPSPDLMAQEYILKADKPCVLHFPCGYANGLKALEVDSELMVFSDKTLEEAAGDQVRYDATIWFDWNKY